MDARPFVLALPLALAAACASTTEKHNAPLDDSTGAVGGLAGGNPTPFGGGGSGNAGAAGAGAASGATGTGGAATQGVTVSGTVVDIFSEDFVTTMPYTMSVNVTGASADPTMPTTTTLYDGTMPFHVPNIPPGPAWLRTAPIATDVLGAWFKVKADGVTTVTLPVVQKEAVNFALAALPVPQTALDAAAHAVLSLVDAAGMPAQGVTATADVTTSIAYDDGPGYTGAHTNARGIVLLLNATPSKSPMVVLTSKDGKTSMFTDLPLDAKTVTLVRIQLP